MTNKLKRFFTVLLGFIAVCCFIVAGAYLGASQASSSVLAAANEQKTDFALVLTEYTLQSTEGLEKIYDPNGKEISLSGNKFLLKVEGEYKFVYGNNVKTLMVLRTNPQVNFEYEFDLNGKTLLTGDLLSVPKATITSVIGAYENYNVTITCNDQIIETVHSSKLDGYVYTIDRGGQYSLTYTCTDSTTLHYTATDTVSFIVTENKALFMKELPEEINYGESINVGAVYGVYNGVVYPATVTITKPSGETENFVNIFYMPTDVGEYTFTASSVIDGETKTLEQKVKVVISATSLLSNFYAIEKMTPAVDLPSYSRTEGKALYVEAQNNRAYAYYSKIIDLRDMTKDDSIINFLPYSDGNSTGQDEIKVSLIDVHNPANYLTVRWWYKKSVSTVSYTSVYVSGKEYGGLNNEKAPSDPSYGTLRTNYGSISWGCYFNSYNLGSKSRMFNIRYDINENAIYSLTDNQYSSADKLHKFLDLDDTDILGYSNVWGGFTTGEVYLKIEFSGSQPISGIYVESICGEKLDYEQIDNAKNESCFVVNTEYEQLPDAVVGYKYDLPSYLVNANLKNIKVSQKVLNGTTVVAENVEDFTPTTAGEYSVVYSAIDNYGVKIDKIYPFTVLATPTPIVAQMPEEGNVDLYTYYTIPFIPVSGGSGKLTVEKDLYRDGVKLETKTGAYLIDSLSDYVVKVKVTDFNGYTETKEYSLVVNDEYVSLVLARDIVAVRAGKVAIFPSFTTYDYSTSTSPAKTLEVIIGGSVVQTFTGDSVYEYTVPTATTELTLKYYSGKGTTNEKIVEKIVKVIPETFINVYDFIVYDDDAVDVITMDEGVMFTVKSNTSIKMPYSLPASGLKFGFGFDAGSINFDNVTLRLTDSIDTDNQVDFKFYNVSASGSSKLEVNGDGRMFTAKYSENEYADYVESDGFKYQFADSTYYYYECYYDATLSKLCYANGTELASVVKSKNGLDFAGFTSGLVHVEFIIDGVSADSGFILYTVSNQNLNTTVEKIGYEDNDTAGPNLMFGAKMVSTSRQTINTKVIIPVAYAHDLIQQSSSSVTIKIVDPDRNTVYNGVISADYELTLSKYGIYSITYTSDDALYNRTNQTFTITVVDDQAPTLTVNGSVNAEYKVGDVLAIPSFTASDNTSGVTTRIYIKNPDAKYSVLTAGQEYSFAQAGTYYLVYSSQDAYNNMVRKTFTIKVVA